MNNNDKVDHHMSDDNAEVADIDMDEESDQQSQPTVTSSASSTPTTVTAGGPSNAAPLPSPPPTPFHSPGSPFAFSGQMVPSLILTPTTRPGTPLPFSEEDREVRRQQDLWGEANGPEASGLRAPTPLMRPVDDAMLRVPDHLNIGASRNSTRVLPPVPAFYTSSGYANARDRTDRIADDLAERFRRQSLNGPSSANTASNAIANTANTTNTANGTNTANTANTTSNTITNYTANNTTCNIANTINHNATNTTNTTNNTTSNTITNYTANNTTSNTANTVNHNTTNTTNTANNTANTNTIPPPFIFTAGPSPTTVTTTTTTRMSSNPIFPQNRPSPPMEARRAYNADGRMVWVRIGLRGVVRRRNWNWVPPPQGQGQN